VNPGSLLTALKRLKRSGLVDEEWRRTDGSRRAKYYALTPGLVQCKLHISAP